MEILFNICLSDEGKKIFKDILDKNICLSDEDKIIFKDLLDKIDNLADGRYCVRIDRCKKKKKK